MDSILNTQPVLLSTAYLPNLGYIQAILNHDIIFIETHEHYIKQTYRNRCEILTANGKLGLSIPLLKQADKEIITDKKISYAEKWQQQHWRTITSAYKNSPYFEYFEHEFKPFYENQFEFLFEFNLELIKTVLKIVRFKKEINFTKEFKIEQTEFIDQRGLSLLNKTNTTSTNQYYQVFSNKFGFTQNLSCIDALFNIGLKTIEL